MIRIKLLFLSLFLCLSAVAFSATVDTLMTFSRSMQKEIPALVVLPDHYAENKQYPVVYLLHGYGGNAKTEWIRLPALKTLTDAYNMILVLPDGGIGSWYFDSPVDSSSRYETYVSHELVTLIDKKYKTIATNKGRAITGLSMGGHGALYLAFRNQDVYGAAGSTSGGVDFRPFPENWELKKRLGTYAENPENWEKNTVINLVHLLTPNSLALIIDCGTEDFFYQVNCQLHEKLMDRNIPHDFITRPGVHDWKYWENSIQYQLLYFHNYFDKNK
jgi:S-formylglutathione hydrolase FrmB